MKINSFRSDYGNHEFVSRRCPMSEGCFTSKQRISHKGYIEKPNSTPVKKRCSLFRGVCLILGAFVMMEGEGTSYSAYEIVSNNKRPLKPVDASTVSQNFFIRLFQGCVEKFQVTTQQIRKSSQKNLKSDKI